MENNNTCSECHIRTKYLLSYEFRTKYLLYSTFYSFVGFYMRLLWVRPTNIAGVRGWVFQYIQSCSVNVVSSTLTARAAKSSRQACKTILPQIMSCVNKNNHTCAGKRSFRGGSRHFCKECLFASHHCPFFLFFFFGGGKIFYPKQVVQLNSLNLLMLLIMPPGMAALIYMYMRLLCLSLDFLRMSLHSMPFQSYRGLEANNMAKAAVSPIRRTSRNGSRGCPISEIFDHQFEPPFTTEGIRS